MLQAELSRVRKEAKAKIASKKAESFPRANKKDLVYKADLKTIS